ncbi:MAG: hypothetical protein J6M35_08625 [Clostridia bacterium]|nr:hypothetical protein [Clostridia bacterium]
MKKGILTKALSVFLLIVCISSVFTSCKKSDANEESGKLSTDISSYKIVRVDAASGKLPTMTSNFKKAILEHTKAELEVTTDYVKRGEELDESGSEILIGDTNRTVSITLLPSLTKKATRADLSSRQKETRSQSSEQATIRLSSHSNIS